MHDTPSHVLGKSIPFYPLRETLPTLNNMQVSNLLTIGEYFTYLFLHWRGPDTPLHEVDHRQLSLVAKYMYVCTCTCTLRYTN